MSFESENWGDGIDPNVDVVGAQKLSTLGTAIAAILFTALVFTVGEAAAKAHHVELRGGEILAAPISLRQSPDNPPEGIDSGGYCNDAGCYIWANPLDPTSGGGGGGGGGGGSGGTGSSSGGSGPPPDPPAIPIMMLPNFDKVYCSATKYGKLAAKWPAAFDDIWAFADDYDPRQEIFSFNTSTPPPHFSPVEGDTARGSSWPSGGTTILYAAALSPKASTTEVEFTDPMTGVAGTITGPYSAVEWAIATLAHEIWHQNGGDDEDQAEGYGYATLKKYRADGGKSCP